MPQALKVSDPAGSSCVYVPIQENGRIVDSKNFELVPAGDVQLGPDTQPMRSAASRCSERPEPRSQAALLLRHTAFGVNRPERGRYPAQKACLQDAADQPRRRPAHCEEHSGRQQGCGHALKPL
jgi:hypothetical protein